MIELDLLVTVTLFYGFEYGASGFIRGRLVQLEVKFAMSVKN